MLYNLYDRETQKSEEITESAAEEIIKTAKHYRIGPYGGMGKGIDVVLYRDESENDAQEYGLVVDAIRYNGEWYNINKGQNVYIEAELAYNYYEPERI